MRRHVLGGSAAIIVLFGGATLARAADNAADDVPASVPAISTSLPTVAAPVRPAMAEVFRPAPVPGEEHAPGQAAADTDGSPSLHPDLLSMNSHSAGNTDIAYDRNERMKPAGGMSLDIPMQ